MLWFGLIWFVKFAEKGFDDMIVWNVVCFHLYLIFVVVFSTYPTGEIGDKYQICIHPYLIFVVYSPQMSDRWNRWQISGLHPPLAATNRVQKIRSRYKKIYIISSFVHAKPFDSNWWVWFNTNKSALICAEDVAMAVATWRVSIFVDIRHHCKLYWFFILILLFYSFSLHSCTASGQSPYLSTSGITASFLF